MIYYRFPLLFLQDIYYQLLKCFPNRNERLHFLGITGIRRFYCTDSVAGFRRREAERRRASSAETHMQVRIEQVDPGKMDSLQTGHASGHKSIGGFVRQWGPYVLTALVVPGGIVIALLMLLRRWNQKRQAVQSTAAA